MQESQWTVPTAVEPSKFQTCKWFLQVRPLKGFFFFFFFFFFWKFFGSYRLTAIVEGWNFNHHETLSNLRSHPIFLFFFSVSLTLFALSLCVFDDTVSAFFPLKSSSFLVNGVSFFAASTQPLIFALLLSTSQVLLAFVFNPFLNRRASYRISLLLFLYYLLYFFFFYFWISKGLFSIAV